MTTRRPGRRDPLEAAIEVALQPGRFIAYRAGWDFVSSLEAVAGQLEALVRTDARRAGGLYETFLAGCYEKAEELDDSSGHFAMFVVSLYCGWIGARQVASADADETARLVLGRMENDPYGFAYTLELDAVKVMSTDSLAAFERQVKVRFEAKEAVEPASDHPPQRNPAYPRRRWGEILRAIYTRQRDVRAYVALCDQTQLSAQDCLAIATMLKARRNRDEALAWVDRGLALVEKHPGGSMAGHDLVTLKRELLTKLGRHGEALEDVWAAFCEAPSTFSYDDLMRFVPKAERAAWHAKAMDTAERADLGPLIGLWLQTREVERLVKRLRAATDPEIEDLSHHRTEPAARRLAKSHPDVAARVFRALGMRILNAKKNKYYDAALSHCEDANAATSAPASRASGRHSSKTCAGRTIERPASWRASSGSPPATARATRRRSSIERGTAGRRERTHDGLGEAPTANTVGTLGGTDGGAVRARGRVALFRQRLIAAKTRQRCKVAS